MRGDTVQVPGRAVTLRRTLPVFLLPRRTLTGRSVDRVRCCIGKPLHRAVIEPLSDKNEPCLLSDGRFQRPNPKKNDYTSMRHTLEISMAERREFENQQFRSRHADINCDRRMASAGERRRAHVDLVGPQRLGARRRNRVSDAGWVSVAGRSDLSGVADRAAEPARDRPANRGGIAGRNSYRDRRADRLGGAGLLPPPQARFHDVLYDALSGIHRGRARSFRPR